jgi:flavin-binding protein dodecin
MLELVLATSTDSAAPAALADMMRHALTSAHALWIFEVVGTRATTTSVRAQLVSFKLLI